MGKGLLISNNIIVLVFIGILTIIVITIGLRELNYGMYKDCVADTERDINMLMDLLKNTKTKNTVATTLRVGSCIEDIVFTDENWETGLRDKSGTEVDCRSDARSHILMFIRSTSVWSVVKSGGDINEIRGALFTPESKCKNIYGMYFNSGPRNIRGPEKDKVEIHCLKFTVEPGKYADIHSWDIISSKEKCVVD